MTVDEALDFFPDISQIKGRLSLMRDIGLGLSQAWPACRQHFSGGESQRIKICAETHPLSPPLARGMEEPGASLYILDGGLQSKLHSQT